MTQLSGSAPAPSPRLVAPLPTDLLLGALVPPVLVGLVAARLVADGLTQAGLISEQIFAGERLPNLNMPNPSPDRSDDHTDE